MLNSNIGILLFSVFGVVRRNQPHHSGAALLRAHVWSSWRRGILLACGLLPITAIPVGAAVGDTPHFSAIAAWGLCWLLLGVTLSTQPGRRAKFAASAQGTTARRAVDLLVRLTGFDRNTNGLDPLRQKGARPFARAAGLASSTGARRLVCRTYPLMNT